MKKTIYIGRVIKQLRKERDNMPQDELAFLSELTRKHMSDIELDKSSPTLDSLQKIAQALDLKTWELVKEAEEQKEDKE